MSEISLVPHQAIIHISAIVNKQMPDGHWNPEAVHNDNFVLIIQGDSAQEVIDKLTVKLEEIKCLWKT